MLSTKNRRHILIGCIAALALSMIFFTVTAAVNRNSLSALQREISRVWYWVLLLSAGFGLQSGLFSYIHTSMRKKSLTAELAASGTISSGAMLACCAHALVGLLPLLGLSGLAVLLARYQLQLILIGLLSNAIGFTSMMGTIKSHNYVTIQAGTMHSCLKKVILREAITEALFWFLKHSVLRPARSNLYSETSMASIVCTHGSSINEKTTQSFKHDAAVLRYSNYHHDTLYSRNYCTTS